MRQQKTIRVIRIDQSTTLNGSTRSCLSFDFYSVLLFVGSSNVSPYSFTRFLSTRYNLGGRSREWQTRRPLFIRSLTSVDRGRWEKQSHPGNKLVDAPSAWWWWRQRDHRWMYWMPEWREASVRGESFIPHSNYFIHECSPWQMSNRLQFIVEKQLRHHKQEAESIDTVDQRIDDPRIPTRDELIWLTVRRGIMSLPLVVIVDQRIDG